MILPSMTAVLAQTESGARPAVDRATLSILVFPLRDETGVGEDLERVVTQALARALEQIGGFSAHVFAVNSPSAMRQVEEGVLRTEDITPPYDDPRSAILVGHALGAEAVLVGSVMERTVDPDTDVVSLTISGTTYEVGPNVDPDTGTPKAQLTPYRPLFGVTGTSLERSVPHRGPVLDLDREAAADAAKKAAAQISGTPEEPKKKKKRRKFLDRWGPALLALAVAVGIAAAASDGDNEPADVAPPPTNLAMGQQNQGVRLSWGPPINPPRNILRYHVQRRVNSGPQHDIGQALVLPTQFSVIDFDVQTGDSIQYFIRAKYVDNMNSPFVTFGTFIVP
jgi:hypothetical protein